MIHTREEWIRDFGAGAEHYVHPTLDPASVPEPVRALVPFAEMFGIGDDVTRNDVIEKQPDSALRSFCDAMQRHRAEFDAFLASLPKDLGQRSETARHLMWLGPAYAEADGELYVCRKVPRDDVV